LPGSSCRAIFIRPLTGAAFFLAFVCSRLFSPYRHEMRTRAQNRMFMLDLSNRFQQTPALRLIGPQIVKIAGQPSRPFNGDQFFHAKSSFSHLRRQFLGPVKEGRGEVLRIARRISMLALGKVSLQDRSKERFVEETVSQ